jgi:hypothetical protein
VNRWSRNGKAVPNTGMTANSKLRRELGAVRV